MKAFRFRCGSGYVFASGDSIDQAYNKAAKIWSTIFAGERAGYMKEGAAPYFIKY